MWISLATAILFALNIFGHVGPAPTNVRSCVSYITYAMFYSSGCLVTILPYVDFLSICYTVTFFLKIFHSIMVFWICRYIVSFLLDSTIGLLIIYIGLKITQYLVVKMGNESLLFGEYGSPPQCHAWAGQCGLYILVMLIEKTLMTLLVLPDFWQKVGKILFHLILGNLYYFLKLFCGVFIYFLTRCIRGDALLFLWPYLWCYEWGEERMTYQYERWVREVKVNGECIMLVLSLGRANLWKLLGLSSCWYCIYSELCCRRNIFNFFRRQGLYSEGRHLLAVASYTIPKSGLSHYLYYDYLKCLTSRQIET